MSFLQSGSRRAVAFRDCLNETEHAALAALTKACNEADGTQYGVPDDADLFFLCMESEALVAVLCIFHMGETQDGMPVDEVLAFTAPKRRREGCFRLLFHQAKDLLRPVVHAMLERNAGALPEGTAAVLAGLQAVHLYDEHLMVLSLNDFPADRVDMDAPGRKPFVQHADFRTLQLSETGAVWRYGECALRMDKEQVYCYAVLTYERFRGQGYGRLFLTEVLRRLKEQGRKTVYLEVSSENTAAMKLYGGLGFLPALTLGCYACSLEAVCDL